MTYHVPAVLAAPPVALPTPSHGHCDSPTRQAPAEGSEHIVVEALRDLARWIYRQLDAECDHLTSDDAVEEGIVINEYTFTGAGRRFGSGQRSAVLS